MICRRAVERTDDTRRPSWRFDRKIDLAAGIKEHIMVPSPPYLSILHIHTSFALFASLGTTGFDRHV